MDLALEHARHPPGPGLPCLLERVAGGLGLDALHDPARTPRRVQLLAGVRPAHPAPRDTPLAGVRRGVVAGGHGDVRLPAAPAGMAVGAPPGPVLRTGDPERQHLLAAGARRRAQRTRRRPAVDGVPVGRHRPHQGDPGPRPDLVRRATRVAPLRVVCRSHRGGGAGLPDDLARPLGTMALVPARQRGRRRERRGTRLRSTGAAAAAGAARAGLGRGHRPPVDPARGHGARHARGRAGGVDDAGSHPAAHPCPGALSRGRGTPSRSGTRRAAVPGRPATASSATEPSRVTTRSDPATAAAIPGLPERKSR